MSSGFPSSSIREALACSNHASSLPELHHLFQEWENRSLNIQTLIKSALVDRKTVLSQPKESDPEYHPPPEPVQPSTELSVPPLPSAARQVPPEVSSDSVTSLLTSSGDASAVVRVQSAWRSRVARQELNMMKEAKRHEDRKMRFALIWSDKRAAMMVQLVFKSWRQVVFSDIFVNENIRKYGAVIGGLVEAKSLALYFSQWRREARDERMHAELEKTRMQVVGGLAMRIDRIAKIRILQGWKGVVAQKFIDQNVVKTEKMRKYMKNFLTEFQGKKFVFAMFNAWRARTAKKQKIKVQEWKAHVQQNVKSALAALLYGHKEEISMVRVFNGWREVTRMGGSEKIEDDFKGTIKKLEDAANIFAVSFLQLKLINSVFSTWRQETKNNRGDRKNLIFRFNNFYIDPTNLPEFVSTESQARLSIFNRKSTPLEVRSSIGKQIIEETLSPIFLNLDDPNRVRRSGNRASHLSTKRKTEIEQAAQPATPSWTNFWRARGIGVPQNSLLNLDEALALVNEGAWIERARQGLLACLPAQRKYLRVLNGAVVVMDDATTTSKIRSQFAQTQLTQADYDFVEKTINLVDTEGREVHLRGVNADFMEALVVFVGNNELKKANRKRASNNGTRLSKVINPNE